MDVFRHNPSKTAVRLPEDVPDPSVDFQAPRELISKCPKAGATPLINARDLAKAVGVGQFWIKDERARMGLGSFKALGAAYVIACDAADGAAKGRTYVTASAGNHGLSVAAGAAAFQAKSRVFISETVPEGFAARLAAQGAEVVRQGATYEDSMAAAEQSAKDTGAILLSDSSWPGYFDAPHRLMEGYLVLMSEVFEQIPERPTHIFLQAGVGGLAGACAAAARSQWGDAPTITVVEPEVAPALKASVEAGRAVITQGPISSMGRLDCKEPSLIALKGLARDANLFVTLTEEEGERGAERLASLGYATTPSGGAGVTACLAEDARSHFDLSSDARVLAILSEEAAA